MSGRWLLLRRLSTAGLGGLFITALSGLAGGVLAKDVGVTLKTTLSHSYKGTVPLAPGTVTKLGNAAVDSDKKNEVAALLAMLKDGDILVLAMHSSTKVFAIGEETHAWESFWKTFGIARPPRLAAVIMGGCMFETVNHKEVPITLARVNQLRTLMNAEVIYTPRGSVQPNIGSLNSFTILTSLLDNKPLSKMDLDAKWYQDVSSRWIATKEQWNQVTLKQLRTVGPGSGAYAAGLEVGLGIRKMADTYPAYKDDPELSASFKDGFAAGRKIDSGKVSGEYQKLREGLDKQ